MQLVVHEDAWRIPSLLSFSAYLHRVAYVGVRCMRDHVDRWDRIGRTNLLEHVARPC